MKNIKSNFKVKSNHTHKLYRYNKKYNKDFGFSKKNSDFFAKKSLGQNFLHDIQVVDGMLKNVSIENKIVVEIGPGKGFLTNEIVKHRPKKLILVEKDRRLIQNLNNTFGSVADIRNMDAMQLNIEDIFKLEHEKITIVANLPYNIGTKLVMNWMNCVSNIDTIIVMLQKEVVDRITAKPRTKDYGRISVLIQSVCKCDKLFDVKPECFTPKPKVTSSVVKIIPKEDCLLDKDAYCKLDKFCKIAFSQRRKKLSNVFKNTAFDKIISEDFLDKRAEELSVEEYLSLSKTVLK